MAFVHVHKFDTDILSGNLLFWGMMAKNMPPAWDGAGIGHPVRHPNGEYLGRILPGRGVYIDCDLKQFGITKHIPFVYERTPIQRLVDKWKRQTELRRFRHALIENGLQDTSLIDRVMAERGAVSSYDGIINARASGNANDVSITKASFTTVANDWFSTFLASGFPVAGSYTTGAGAAMTYATTGALSFGMTNPSASTTKYLLTFGYTAAQQINMAILADLLVAAGGINTTTTTATTVNSTALTRYTTGAGVLMTFDTSTLTGITATNMTVQYTNQGGTAAQSTGAVGFLSGTTANIVQQLSPFAQTPYMRLASGDYGVRVVQTVTFSTLQTAGVIAANLYYPMGFIPGIAANSYIERDSTVQIDGLTAFAQDSSNNVGCLVLYLLTNTTSTGQITAFMRSCIG